MSFDWKRLSTQDRVIVGGAAVAFIAAFLPWYGVSFEGLGITVSGWSAGFTAWAGALLLTAAGVLLVLRRSGATFNLGNMGPSVLVAGVSAVGLLLVIIRWISFPRYHGLDVGARYGIYIALIAGLAEVAAAVTAMRASGEQVPWAQSQQATEAPPEAPATPEE
jgi:hypothetical protein